MEDPAVNAKIILWICPCDHRAPLICRCLASALGASNFQKALAKQTETQFINLRPRTVNCSSIEYILGLYQGQTAPMLTDSKCPQAYLTRC